MLLSPYMNHLESEWLEITNKLIEEFPLSSKVLVSIVESAWEDLIILVLEILDLK